MKRIEVTDVKIRLANVPNRRLVAFASIVLNGEFIIHDLAVLESSEGLYVTMPAKKSKSGDFRDVAHPLSTELRGDIEDTVLDAYSEALNKCEEESNKQKDSRVKG